MTLRTRIARLMGARPVAYPAHGHTHATPRRRFGGIFGGHRHRRHHAAPIHTTAGGVPHAGASIPGHSSINRAINTVTGRGHHHTTTTTTARPIGGGLGYRLRSLFHRGPRTHRRHAVY